MTTRSQNNILKPKQFFDGTTRYHLPIALLVISTIPTDPTCYSEAQKFSEWREAMDAEFSALMKQGTWSLVPYKAGMNLKACLVAKGYHQQQGLDYDDTFNPVIKPTTIWLVLSHAVSNKWPVRQIDISNAFLHGFLSEVVHMQQPVGYVHPQYPTHVCKLHKALYGLKQAPRAWFSHLSDKLVDLGFINSQSDNSLFVYVSASLTILLIKPSPSTQISVYSDADWADSPDDRKSTSGYCIYYGHNLVSWDSKKQPIVARSSTEAEYRAVAHATAKTLWLLSLLRELHIFIPSRPILWCDNIGATYLAANPVFHARTKHVEIDYHVVREKVHNKSLDVRFLSSKDQIADVLTKPLVSVRFSHLRDKLNMRSPPLNLQGHDKDKTNSDSKIQMTAAASSSTSSQRLRIPSSQAQVYRR
ncbi:hypothetical protein F0562_025264 [Nyssa sinensis]|uniref:Reverse transcriptase Ty1/copia-type domain-containing protein n=1 Tax=Nyssa sinensis TaxID=561372 RepID=A0A5J5BJH0_9ASTE|nr:hypothetical protein F0562_025264 [Nyssa sinensis]